MIYLESIISKLNKSLKISNEINRKLEKKLELTSADILKMIACIKALRLAVGLVKRLGQK